MKLFRFSILDCVIVGALSANLLIHLPASAQLSLSPLFLEEEAVRGRAQGVITMTNTTEKPMRVRAYAEPFTYGHNGFVLLNEDAADLSPYLQFSPREVVIEPGSQQRVRLLGQFPPGLPEGEYRAVVFAEELSAESQADTSVAIRARVGTTVYMRQGELSPRLEGQSAVLSELVGAPGEQVVELVVENQGLATARTEVFWQLQQEGTEVMRGQVSKKTVIAESDRIFAIELTDNLPSGQYTLEGELHWSTLGNDTTQSFELPVLVP